jgi:hypothetical protein
MPWISDCNSVTHALSDRFTMTELCERFGVSRRIGYKWLARFTEDGKRGLVNRSRRPHRCPTQIRPVLAELLCEFPPPASGLGRAQIAQGAAQASASGRRPDHDSGA